jgi:D-threo-aldose 1-dehydrogenase
VGLGVNRVEPIELTLDLDEPRPDGFLLAGRYSLLDHDRALQRVMPQAVEQGVGIVVGGPYSSGATAGGEHFEYQKASQAVLEKLERIRAVARAHGVDVKAAALQFALAHPAVVAAIPGSTRALHANEDHAALSAVIPSAFWNDLRQQGLVNALAPVPTV